MLSISIIIFFYTKPNDQTLVMPYYLKIMHRNKMKKFIVHNSLAINIEQIKTNCGLGNIEDGQIIFEIYQKIDNVQQVGTKGEIIAKEPLSSVSSLSPPSSHTYQVTQLNSEKQFMQYLCSRSYADGSSVKVRLIRSSNRSSIMPNIPNIPIIPLQVEKAISSPKCEIKQEQECKEECNPNTQAESDPQIPQCSRTRSKSEEITIYPIQSKTESKELLEIEPRSPCKLKYKYRMSLIDNLDSQIFDLLPTEEFLYHSMVERKNKIEQVENLIKEVQHKIQKCEKEQGKIDVSELLRSDKRNWAV